jgi:hypothetical protein
MGPGAGPGSFVFAAAVTVAPNAPGCTQQQRSPASAAQHSPQEGDPHVNSSPTGVQDLVQMNFRGLPSPSSTRATRISRSTFKISLLQSRLTRKPGEQRAPICVESLMNDRQIPCGNGQ